MCITVRGDLDCFVFREKSPKIRPGSGKIVGIVKIVFFSLPGAKETLNTYTHIHTHTHTVIFPSYDRVFLAAAG